MDVKPKNPAIFVKKTDGRYIYSNGVTKDKYTIVEVTV